MCFRIELHGQTQRYDMCCEIVFDFRLAPKLVFLGLFTSILFLEQNKFRGFYSYM